MKITKNHSLGPYMTFDESKQLPIHSWFWYKEGYAPQIVDWAVSVSSSQSRVSDNGKQDTDNWKPKTLLDPFCGVGTSLLAAKKAGINSIGVDASDLAAFVSRAKTRDYSSQDIEQAREFIARIFSESRGPAAQWDFELFDPRAAFPKRNLNDILFLRERIETLDTGPRDLLLVALLSVLPQVSLVVKDGGVLKIKKDKRAMPIKDAFRKRVKRMLNDLGQDVILGPEPEVYLGDARGIDLPEESVDIIVTSPPYLNNIDYSKVYGMELSLLSLSKASAEEVRMRSVRSFIGREMGIRQMPEEVGEIGERIPIIGTYFSDMEEAIAEMHRLLRPGCSSYVVVSNSVIHETHVLVDEILAQIGERLGFKSEIVIGAERIADVRPHKVKTRESAVVLKKD
jgi:SAM-dependent methyltransferase